MVHIFQFIFCLLTITSAFSLSEVNDDNIVYVSTHGVDVEDCGSFTKPCGTLYFGSTLLDIWSNISTIYVVDGQNESIIQSYIDNIKNNNNTNDNSTNKYYSPCLPKQKLFNSLSKCKYQNNGKYQCESLIITIIFDDIYIQSFRDWYPHICDDEFLVDSIIENNYITLNGTHLISNTIENNYLSFFDLFYDIQESKSRA
eukprot:153684_1